MSRAASCPAPVGRRASPSRCCGGCDELGGSRPELVWGIHGTKPGWLHKPRVAAFDAEDHLYLADLTDRIQVFDRDGKYLRGWRTPDFNVDGPSGLTVDRLRPAARGRHPFLPRPGLLAARASSCSRSATACRGRPPAGSATRPTW